MSVRETWRSHSGNLIPLLLGIVPGYFLGLIYWIGGHTLLFYAVLALIAYALVSMLIQFPLFWIGDRLFGRRKKGSGPRPKWNEGLKSDAAFFSVGFGMGFAVSLARQIWINAGAA